MNLNLNNVHLEPNENGARDFDRQETQILSLV